MKLLAFSHPAGLVPAPGSAPLELSVRAIRASFGLPGRIGAAPFARAAQPGG